MPENAHNRSTPTLASLRDRYAAAMRYQHETVTSPVPVPVEELGTWAVEHLPALLDRLEAAEAAARPAPLGYITAWRDEGGVLVEFSGTPFALDQALDDLHEMAPDLPGAELLILELREWDGQRRADRGGAQEPSEHEADTDG
jgi:hypothetical protein